MIDLVHTTGLALVYRITCWPGPRLTVIVKGVFDLVEGGVMRRAEERVQLGGDEPLEGAPGRLRYASDLAPFKPAADVMLVGAAPPAAAPAAGQHAAAPLLSVGAHRFEAKAGAFAAFAPLSPDAPDRRSKLGTYDDRWVEARWPYWPDDFDVRYFNAAPLAMQIEGYLQGDERVVLDHLVAERARLATQLPGIRARCFLVDREDHLSELVLRLDTLWLDAASRRAALVWRGITDVSSEDAEEVAGIYLATEALSAPPEDIAHHAAARALELVKRDKAATAQADAAARAAARAQNRNAPPMPDDTAALAELRRMFEKANAPADCLAVVDNAKTMRGALDALQALVDVDPEKAEAEIAAAKARTKKLLADKGLDTSLFDKLDEEEAPEDGLPPWTRERVRAAAAAGESMEGADLRGRDLSELDLTGAKLARALLSDAVLRGTKLYDADLREAVLAKADLTGASLGLAKLDKADLTGAKASGADLWSAALAGALLDEAALDGARLDEAKAEGASLRKADLTGASLVKANLRGARLVEAKLDNVNAAEVVLEGASMEGARGARIRLVNADLVRLRAGLGASLPGAELCGARADGSIFMGADLTGAQLSKGQFVRADFSRAKLDGASLDGCHCENANFTKASLSGAILCGANLAGARMESANLEQADARGANLYEANVFRARTAGLLLEGAHVAMTQLVRKSP